MIGNIVGGLLNKGAVLGDFESIATVTVGSGGSASISFSSIPSTYQHLQIRFMTPFTVQDGEIRIQFNSDTSTSYRSHNLSGTGSAAAAGTISQTSISTSYDGNATRNSAYAKSGIIDILDYANTNKNKVTRALTGIDVNGAGRINFESGLWPSTSAISSIQITQYGFDGTSYGVKNLAQYSHFALYGIKG